ncbi:hypothetical protein [Sinorhizobium alkalisoli]|uniref:hypothetical protein n=1 Tax=Sinorhizobium alkalisoli TaxID=1752398 RepID=UPI0013F4F522|nr:hypothetical protein [Sinorhizobium alkalisoli]MCG5478989.1 hypothetical protein [Sinorhizobium alkalisoli]
MSLSFQRRLKGLRTISGDTYRAHALNCMMIARDAHASMSISSSLSGRASSH